MRGAGAYGCMVVMPVWNNVGDSLACLASLSAAGVPAERVVLVDNGSSDGSAHILKAAFPGVVVVAMAENLGYGGGCNAGFRRASALGAATVVFLNNDTLVDPSFLSPLLDALAADPGVGIAVPKIFYASLPGTIWYGGGRVRLSSGLVAHEGLRCPDGPRFSRPGPTGYATGCCLAMRTGDFASLGGFDEAFRMYGEDVDLSLRVRQRGMEVRYVPASHIWHKVSASLQGGLSRKLLFRSGAMFRLLVKHRAWRGVVAYLVLEPFRLLRGAFGMVRYGIGARFGSRAA